MVDYSKLYITYFPKLVRFSRSYILSEEDAENIVQNIFLYLWENPEVLASITNTNAYLFTMVKNRCIDFLRKEIQAGEREQSLSHIHEQELELYSLQKFDENSFNQFDLEAIITDAINSLPDRCKEIFVLSRIEGIRHKEIASLLNISTNTIEGQIVIALRKLRMKLKDYISLWL